MTAERQSSARRARTLTVERAAAVHGVFLDEFLATLRADVAHVPPAGGSPEVR